MQDLLRGAVVQMVDVFHAVHKMDDEMSLVIQGGGADVIVVEPGGEFSHEVVEAACFHVVLLARGG